MKKFFNLVLIAAVFAPLFAGAELVPQTGNHFGDARPLKYRIEYLSPQGETLVGENGISFVPFVGEPSFDGTILPARYFGSYALYFGGGTIRFRVHIKNAGPRAYRNLQILAQQEFLNVTGGAGEPISEAWPSSWLVRELGPGAEIVLDGEFTIPNAGQSGLDQTHLQIIHWGNASDSKSSVAGGQIIVDDPQAGIWCPASPG